MKTFPSLLGFFHYALAEFPHTLHFDRRNWSWAEEDIAFSRHNTRGNWEPMHFRYADPVVYTDGEYHHTRENCIWSEPLAEDEFSRNQIRSALLETLGNDTSRWQLPNVPSPGSLHDVALHFKAPGKSWGGHSPNAKVSSCKSSITDVDGNVIETFITKFGPIELQPGETATWTMLPAQPKSKSTSYLVETVDGYYDGDGKPLLFPPLHPHHAVSSTLSAVIIVEI